MVRPVINGPSLLETMMPTVSSDVTDGLSQTRVTFSAKPAPLDTPSSRPDAERQPGVHVSQILCVAILRQPLLRRTFETHRPGTSQRAGCWSETSHTWWSISRRLRPPRPLPSRASRSNELALVASRRRPARYARHVMPAQVAQARAPDRSQWVGGCADEHHPEAGNRRACARRRCSPMA